MATIPVFTTFQGRVLYKEKLYTESNKEFRNAWIAFRELHPDLEINGFPYKVICAVDGPRSADVRFYDAKSIEDCTEDKLMCRAPFIFDKGWHCPAYILYQMEDYYDVEPTDVDIAHKLMEAIQLSANAYYGGRS